MARKRRGFGRLRSLPSGRVQAGYVGPDLTTHYAATTFQTRMDAEAWLAKERELIASDTWRAPKIRREMAMRRPDTIGQYAETWLSSRPLKRRTHALYRRLLDRFIIPELGDVPIPDLTPPVVRAWYASLDASHPTQRSHTYALLRGILATAVGDEIITSNPCKIQGAGSTGAKRQLDPPTLTQLETAIDAMPPRYRALVFLGGWCGLRFGELAELRRKDLDLDRGIVRIRRGVTRVGRQVTVGPPKTMSSIRDVSIPPHLLPAIQKHLDEHVKPGAESLLFPSVGDADKHVHHQTIYRSWYKAREAAGRPDLRIHDLRHAGAVFAAQTGATLAELMARLGHSTPAAAMRYQHVAGGRDAQIAADLSRMAEANR